MTAPPARGHARLLAHRVAVAGLVLLFPASILSSRVAGPLFWLLALTGLGLLAARRGAALPPDRRLRLALALAALGPLVLNIVSVVVHGRPGSAITTMPFLALPLLLVLALRVGFEARHLMRAAMLGAAAALGAALLGLVVYGAERADITMNAILFGQGALSFAVLALLGLAWRLPTRWPVMAAAAAVAGFFAFLMAGYRGGLLALPIVLAALPWLAAARRIRASRQARSPQQARSPRPPRRPGALTLVLSAISAVAVIGLAVTISPLSSRLGQIDDEIAGYAAGRIDNSSVGARMAMWQAATTMLAERPVFGVGARGFQAALARMQREGRFPADVALFDHAHSTYLTVAAEYGLVGLVVLAAVVVALWRLLGVGDAAVRRIGRALLACWLAFALTNDVLAHQTTQRLLVLMVAVCCAAAVARIGAPNRPQTSQHTTGHHR